MNAVTIDGPSGAGKTAVARALAVSLGWRWVSAGMVYRALASADGEPIVDFVTAADGAPDPVVVLGPHRFAEADLLGSEIGDRASRLATDARIRDRVAMTMLRACVQPCVIEGRSMAALLPDALMHVYLWADAAARRGRNAAIGAGTDPARDARDQRRQYQPLTVAAGMVAWNSTRSTLPQTVAALTRRVRIAQGLARVRVVWLAPSTGSDRLVAPGVRSAGVKPAVPVVEGIDIIGVDATDPDDAACGADVVVWAPVLGRLDAHLPVLLAGNEVATLAGSTAAADLNLSGRVDDTLLRRELTGFTADVLRATPRAGRTLRDWSVAAAGCVRCIRIPAAASSAREDPIAGRGPDPIGDGALVIHRRDPADTDAVLYAVAQATATEIVVADHVGDPRFALLVEAARPGGRVRVLATTAGGPG